MVPKVVPKIFSSKSLGSQLSKTVSTVVVRLLDRFLSLFEISSKSHDFHNSGFQVSVPFFDEISNKLKNRCKSRTTIVDTVLES